MPTNLKTRFTDGNLLSIGGLYPGPCRISMGKNHMQTIVDMDGHDLVLECQNTCVLYGERN